MHKVEYGKLFGEVIIPPVGWELIPEGEEIPQDHVEFIINPPFRIAKYNPMDPEHDKYWSAQWASPRRCHCTMTPPKAMKFGHVIAFARMKKVIARIWMSPDPSSIIPIRDPRQFLNQMKHLEESKREPHRVDEEVCNMFYGRSHQGVMEMIEKYTESASTLPKPTYYYPSRELRGVE
ncbi:hypothetical protein YerA41_038 [Yersinia phage YerA41]|nr:hypothetical protein YerA41_038 [Yersinia phage YerA41]